jgi:hypothetical protein
MGVDHAVTSHVSEPQMERHTRIVQIVLNAAIRVHQNVLHDIAGIDTLADAAIESHGNHPAQRFPMPVQQLANRLRIAVPGLLK